MNLDIFLKRSGLLILIVTLIGSILPAIFVAYSANAQRPGATASSTIRGTSPRLDLRSVLGVDGNLQNAVVGIPWIRLSYPTCGKSGLTSQVLKKTIQRYHHLGMRVMLSYCQRSIHQAFFDPKALNDIAQSRPDAVQCGNEQMKSAAATIYITPLFFARFFDLCQRTIHPLLPDIPILLGSLDPHVGGIDYQPLYDQVYYLDAIQNAMNTQVHPGGHWTWRSQIVGLIDSWHNGYPDQSVNSLYQLFLFWAQQFHVDLRKGELGKHLWVIEGTGCFRGCGINASSSYAVAVSHILTLITDVQTTMRYGVPFFYFSGKDFVLNGVLWPMGVLDLQGHAKPLRQDLRMGARTLTMSCPTGKTLVRTQVQLLSMLYHGCTLPGNYVAILES